MRKAPMFFMGPFGDTVDRKGAADILRTQRNQHKGIGTRVKIRRTAWATEYWFNQAITTVKAVVTFKT